MFEPITTSRLLIRSVRADDADSLHERRNHPDAARYQNWQTPFAKQRVDELVGELIEMAGPENDEWWMTTLEELDTGVIVGDLVVHLTSDGRSAEIGYTLHPDFWGRGYAVEAVSGLVRYLFDDLGVSRIWGMLHPDNIASAMVLERVGMLFEGHTRGSFWLGDDNSDDWIYGMLRSDWETWVGRPSMSPESITLEDVTAENLDDVMRLRTHRSQERMVAPMSWTLAQWAFPEEHNGATVVPWLKAIVADGDIVGAVMLTLQTEHHDEPYLWRLLIDRLHQRRGIGRAVLGLVFEELIDRGASSVTVSWVDGKGSPRDFYTGLGFVPTGEIEDGEVVARKQLEP